MEARERESAMGETDDDPDFTVRHSCLHTIVPPAGQMNSQHCCTQCFSVQHTAIVGFQQGLSELCSSSSKNEAYLSCVSDGLPAC